MRPDLNRLSCLTVALIVALSAGEAQAWPNLFKKKNKGPAAIPAGEEMRSAEMTAAQMLADARNHEAAGHDGAAMKGYEAIVAKYSFTSMAPEAQFRIAAALEKNGKYEKAFDAYQDLITRYRQSPQFSEALDRQYNIVAASRTRRTGRTFGIKTKIGADDLIVMLGKIIANAPQGTHAAEAQFEIAQIHEEEDEKDQAIRAFRKVVENYPRSPLAADAQTRIGRTYMAKVEGGERDRSNVAKAREAMQEASVFPTAASDMAGMEGAIDDAAAENAYSTGKFYQKRGNYKGAMIYYADILKNPRSPHYEEVRDRVSDMSAKEPGLLESVKNLAINSRSLAVPATANLKNKGDYFGPPGPVSQIANAGRPAMRGDFVPNTPLEPGDLPVTPGTPDNSLLDPSALPPPDTNVPSPPVAPQPPALEAPAPPPGVPVEEKPAVPVEQPNN